MTIHSAILESLSSAVVLVDHALSIQYLNQAAEVLFYISDRQAHQQSIATLIRDEREFVECINTVFDNHLPCIVRARHIVLHNSKSITIDFVASSLQLDGDELAVIEITQIDRNLKLAREEQILSQQRATSALLRGLAHEIKNPLGGIRGAAQLLEKEIERAEIGEYTKVIISEVDRLRNLVDRMIGFNNQPRKMMVNIHQLLERVRLIIQSEKAEGIAFHCDYDPSIPELNADPDQIIQVVLNIAKNALQALGGHGSLSITTRIERRVVIGSHYYKYAVRIDIRDDGPGVLPQLQENLFYPMVTGRADGTGLGLTIAQMLIHRHNGIIEYESRPGETCFTVLLPLLEEGERP